MSLFDINLRERREWERERQKQSTFFNRPIRSSSTTEAPTQPPPPSGSLPTVEPESRKTETEEKYQRLTLAYPGKSELKKWLTSPYFPSSEYRISYDIEPTGNCQIFVVGFVNCILQWCGKYILCIFKDLCSNWNASKNQVLIDIPRNFEEKLEKIWQKDEITFKQRYNSTNGNFMTMYLLKTSWLNAYTNEELIKRCQPKPTEKIIEF